MTQINVCFPISLLPGYPEHDFDGGESCVRCLATKPASRQGWKCECGWFAKFLSESHYYNGQWDCYSYTVECKRCGVVTVECV